MHWIYFIYFFCIEMMYLNVFCLWIQLFKWSITHFHFCFSMSTNSESSMCNQRIKRLWAELNRVVSFHSVLCFEHGVLDSLNELRLLCLHYIYLPWIQRAATEFHNQWNNNGWLNVFLAWKSKFGEPFSALSVYRYYNNLHNLHFKTIKHKKYLKTVLLH